MYVPATGSVNVSRKAVGPETNKLATVDVFGWRTRKSRPGTVLPAAVNVTFCPAVAVNVRTATSPIVVIVTVVGVPIAVVPRVVRDGVQGECQRADQRVARIDQDRVRTGHG